MYIDMPVDKNERVDLRIRDDTKIDGLALAEMLGFGARGLTALLTHLLVEAVNKAKQQSPELFADARKRVIGRQPRGKPKRRKARAA